MAEIPTKTGTISTSTMPNRREVDGELRDRLGVGRGPAGTDKSSRRAKIAEVIKTILWVIPLTILIWVYAEREQLVKDQEITGVSIKLKSTASDQMVVLNNPAERVTLVLDGPQAGLNKVRDILTDSGVLVEISDDLQSPFEGDIQLAERLGRNSLFAKEAVTVVRTKPAAVKILAQKKVSTTVKVQMRPEDRLTITDAKFVPEEVKLDIPESLVGPTTRPDDLPVYADLKTLIDQGAGTRTGKVQVLFSSDQKTWPIPPQSVTATVTIKPAKTLPLKSIPVVARIHAYLLEKDDYVYTFVEPREKMVRDVVVTGPAKAIDELERRTQKADKPFTPTAVIDITPDDLSRLINNEGELRKPLGPGNYDMPADLAKDLTVTSPVSEVIIKITKKG